MECYELPSSSPIQAFSSSGQLAQRDSLARPGPSSKRLATSTKNVHGPASSIATQPGQRSALLDALNGLGTSQPRALRSHEEEEGDAPGPSKRRKKELSIALTSQSALKSAKKAEEKIAKDLERDRKRNEKATLQASKKDWMEANKLRRSKTETFKEMVVDVDGALTAPAAKTSATGLGPSFAGALHGAGITALESRLKESGASINIVGSTEPRMANAGRALSSALGISDQILPDPPVIRLRRKIKARLDVEHRIWVPLPAATFQHEPTAIILLTATEVLAHLAKGSGALAKLIPRVKAGLASSGGVHQTQAFQLFFIVVGLQVHFRKKAQKNDQDWRRAVQAEMAKEDAEEAGAEATTSAPARKRKAPAAVDPAAEVTQEDAEIEMLRLTMEHGVYVIHAKALVDAVEAIVDIVGDVGIRPYKMIANSHLPFCTDVSRTGTSATDEGTYLLMLQQIPRVTEPAARAIQCEFPTVRLLMEAYDEAMERDRRSNAGTSSKNGSHVDNLVAECVIRNRVDGKASSRKVGQAMSKRIGMVLTGDDPLALL